MLETNYLWKWSDTRTGLKGAKKMPPVFKKTKNKKQAKEQSKRP